MDRCGLEYERVTPRNTTGRSKEFWAGHALAQVQAATGCSFREIIAAVSVPDVISLYEKYHDKAMNDLPWMLSGEERRAAVEEINARFPEVLRAEFERARGAAAVPKSQTAVSPAAASKETHLKEMRLRNGLSQSQLAAASGVPLRTIQQYEQQQKNINKAQFEYIVRLSRVLNCEPVQLLEL
ncbi:MAG: helix-turn-helix transcriptional regulator [Mogibacterium sp.]|nr:helix-turn-helix transcriptional regulator [Mogibacterium sp.]